MKGSCMQNDKAQPLVGVVLTVLSVLLLAGLLTFAGPCGVHDGGTVSSCHWASRASMGVGVVLALIAIVLIFERDEGERRGLSLAAALLGVLVALMPGVIVDLCMMQTMRCHVVMRPFALVIGVLIAVVGGADLIRRLLALVHR